MDHWLGLGDHTRRPAVELCRRQLPALHQTFPSEIIISQHFSVQLYQDS